MTDLKVKAILGGSNAIVDSQEFEGGSVRTVIGGAMIDLSKAQLKDGQATINVKCLIGGVELIVPSDWEVLMQPSVTIGGTSDEREQSAAAENRPRLTIEGRVCIGGVVVKGPAN